MSCASLLYRFQKAPYLLLVLSLSIPRDLLGDQWHVHAKAETNESSGDGSARLQAFQHVHETSGRSTTEIEWELVVARYDEELDWLEDIPHLWHITIYNKGGDEHPMPQLPKDRCTNNTAVSSCTVINLPNEGKEAHTLATHISRRYDALASYTVFAQGYPKTHNEHFIELMERPKLLGPVQTLSRYYRLDGWEGSITPISMVEAYSTHPWYRSERFSTRTMNSVYFHDLGAARIGNTFREAYNLPAGTNLIKEVLDRIGLKDWMDVRQEVASFAYGALLGFEKSRPVRHPREVYDKLAQVASEHPINPSVIERMWGIILGGPQFQDI